MGFFQFANVVLAFHFFSFVGASNVIGVSTRHHEPYMYQNSNGTFTDGIEFHMLRTIAEHWKMELEIKGHAVEVGENYINGTDIIIGGLQYGQHNIPNTVVSMPYFQDDLTWCIQKAGKWPWLINLIIAPSPTVWFIIFFGYGYVYGTLLYIIIQFDRKYKHRNNRDWHYTVLLISYPSFAGIGQRFQPISWNIRMFYGVILIGMIFCVQVALSYWYKYLQVQAPMHQIATIDEIVVNDFVLKGSIAAKNSIVADQKYKSSQIQWFSICPNISNCLAQLTQSNTIAIGASRQQMYSSAAFDPNAMYCFHPNEHIASYPVAMAINGEFYRQQNIKEIIQRIIESGLIQKWRTLYKQKHIDRTVDFGTPRVRVEQLELVFYLVMPCAWVVASLTCLVEIFVDRKSREKNAGPVWMYLEQFFDGKRYYLKNLPEKLLQSRSTQETVC